MPQQSITNRLIGNIKQTTVNNGAAFTNSNNVICIDSSTNRIGINTRDPNYSIDICGNSSNHGIRCENIYVNNIELSNDLSYNRLMGHTICGTNVFVDFIDISDCIYTTLSGNRIDVSLLVINEISANNNGFLYIPTISCDNIVSTVSGDFFNIDVNNINIRGVLDIKTGATFEQSEVDLQNMTCAISGDINNLDCSRINVREHVSISGELTVDDNTKLNGLIVQSDASFVGKIEAQDASFNSLDVSNTLKVNNLKNINGDTILNNGALELDGSVKFDNATVDIGTLNIIDQLNTNSNARTRFNGTVDFENTVTFDDTTLQFINGSHLIIPIDTTSNKNPGIFYFDNTNKTLNVYDSTEDINTFTSKILYATYELSNNYYTENSNNLFIDISSNTTNKQIKYIPISRKVSSDLNKFIDEEISYNSIIINNSTNTNKSYEINANVCLKYINEIRGDVEPNTFEFLLIRNNDNDSSFNELISNKNTIIAFDTSFNYVTTSLTYIEHETNFSTDASGFMFGIYSLKDLSNLHIDSFYTIIKEL